MGNEWQPCPYCKVLFNPWLGDVLRTHCPACHQPLPAPAVVPSFATALPPPPMPAGHLTRPARRHPPYELLAALLAVWIITVVYAVGAFCGIPAPSSLIGHGLGVVGFSLMLATETLYTLRKRIRSFTFGRTSTWLQVHVCMGIVGPYLVLLHSAGRFNGLAGVLTLLTIVMVVSGFIGRYLYTAVPRSLDGVELAAQELEAEINAADRELQALGIELPAAVTSTALPRQGWLLVLGRGVLHVQQRWRLKRALAALDADSQAQAVPLRQLLDTRFRLQMQMQSLAVARRLLALWHMAHIPLGVVVFSLAFLHVGGALYYATFSK